MNETYTTIQGDTWDAVAHKVYGSYEQTQWLMENNQEHLDTFVFDHGTVLTTPPLPPNTGLEGLPEWRRL